MRLDEKETSTKAFVAAKAQAGKAGEKVILDKAQ